MMPNKGISLPSPWTASRVIQQIHTGWRDKYTTSHSHSLFVQKDSNDNANDEDHGQDWPNHPDQALLSVNLRLWVRVVYLKWIREGAGCICLEERRNGAG